jgi:hypothetical protein
MTKSAFSARVFAVYLFLLGPVLVLVPNLLLSLFGIAPANEVWIRVVGLLAFCLGVYIWVSANFRPFLEASVYTRVLVFVVFLVFAIQGLVSPMIVLFGTIDLCGGLWTWFALKADARSSVPALATQH